MVWAARAANAHDVVTRLPLGYETRVGETGLALSGGQRQRVAIARALYNDPPVAILEETGMRVRQTGALAGLIDYRKLIPYDQMAVRAGRL